VYIHLSGKIVFEFCGEQFLTNPIFPNQLTLTLSLPGSFPAWRYPQLLHGFGGKFKSQKVDTARHFLALGQSHKPSKHCF